MNDRLDQRIRQLMHEMADTAPDPNDWPTTEEPSTDQAGALRQRRPLVLALAACVALGVTVGAIAIGSRSSDRRVQPVNDTSSRAASDVPTPIDAAASTTPGSTESTEPELSPPTTNVATTTATGISVDQSVVVSDDRLPPGVIVPAALPVIGESIGLGEPLRSDPIQRWLAVDPNLPAPTWFIRRDGTGLAIAGIQRDTIAANGWGPFAEGQAVQLGQVEGRILGRTIGWQSDGHLETVYGIDVTDAELVEIAIGAVELGTEFDIDGYEQVPAISSIDATSTDVSYENSEVAIRYLGAPAAVGATLQDVAFMMKGPNSPVYEGPVDGSFSVDSSGLTVTWLRLIDGQIALVTSPAGYDPVAVVNSIEFRRTDTIAIRQLMVVPSEKVQHDYGTISMGRWAIYSYTDADGRTCRDLRTSFAGGGRQCSHDWRCPPDSIYGSDNIPTSYIFAVPDNTPAAITFDGQPSTPTTEQSNGYTFYFGTVPPTFSMESTIEVTSDGQSLCPPD